jgi:arylsulfatase
MFTTEGGIRVPAFIHGLGNCHGSAIADVFATVMDIAPTLLDLAGVTHPGARYKGREVAPMRGRSLRGWLEGGAEAVHPPGTMTGWELFGRRAVRRGAWKALYVPGADGVARWQLYDLARDRGEVRDLAAEHPGILAELLRGWEEYAATVGVVDEPISIYDADPALWETGWVLKTVR